MDFSNFVARVGQVVGVPGQWSRGSELRATGAFGRLFPCSVPSHVSVNEGALGPRRTALGNTKDTGMRC